MESGSARAVETAGSHGHAGGILKERKMKEKVFDIVAAMCGIDEVKEEDFLKEDLGLDSLSLVELVARVEDAFQIQFDMGELDPNKLLSVEDLCLLVEKTL